MTTVQNLDAACAKLGATLGTRDAESRITKALGVLEEQGVYALFLYLHARENKWGSDALATFLRQNPSQQNALLGPNPNNGDVFGPLQTLAGDLDKLLFARDLLHRALVYARYHAKAAQVGGARTP
jgi:hypothetical protein